MSRTTWRARRADLIWRDWDEDLQIVYDVASGDTHALDRFSGDVVKHLQDDGLTAVQLASRLAGESNRPRMDLERQIADLLPRLDRLGLIDPIS